MSEANCLQICLLMSDLKSAKYFIIERGSKIGKSFLGDAFAGGQLCLRKHLQCEQLEVFNSCSDRHADS